MALVGEGEAGGESSCLRRASLPEGREREGEGGGESKKGSKRLADFIGGREVASACEGG